MTDWSQAQGLEAEILVEMKTVLLSVDTYRSMCGYPRDKHDITFRAGWKPSCEELFTLVEATLYDIAYDGHLKEALKSSPSPADFAANQFQEFLAHVVELIKAKQKDRGKNSNKH